MCKHESWSHFKAVTKLTKKKELFGHKDQKYVWRREGEAFNPDCEPANYAEETSLCKKDNKIIWTPPILSRYNEKLVDGYQKHLIEVKMAKGNLTKYKHCCMYIFDPADFVIFPEDL